MTDEQLTIELAVRAMRWRLAPGRFLKPEGGWTPRSAFRPLVDVRDSFRALDSVTDNYSVARIPGGLFTVKVCVAGRIGKATGEQKARAISLALARAMGLDSVDADAVDPTGTQGSLRRRNHGG